MFGVIATPPTAGEASFLKDCLPAGRLRSPAKKFRLPGSQLSPRSGGAGAMTQGWYSTAKLLPC